MITIWLSALALAAVTYLLMWRTPTRTKLVVIAVLLVIPLALALWIIAVVGDQMHHGAILIEAAPNASP
ncbi:MAG: hypothetical protein H0V18_04110 [Pyrinomonadaceae bacterium]|nr:hypothetical protein [Pyrinomonadaceae bacterium]